MTLVDYTPTLLGRVELEPTADKVDLGMNGYAWAHVKLLQGSIYGYIDFPWWIPLPTSRSTSSRRTGSSSTRRSPIFAEY